MIELRDRQIGILVGIFISALTFFSSTSTAGGVYNCSMNKFIVLQDDEVFDETLSEFSFEVGKHKLIFTKGSYFIGTEIPIRYNNAEGWIEASEFTTSFTIKDGRFHYTFLTFMNVYSASGECDYE